VDQPIALAVPEQFAGPLVEGDEQRISLVLVVQQEHLVVVNQRADGRPPERLENRQRIVPEQVAFEIVANQAAIAEERNDALAVGDRRR
jgi:hypothetical protein